jgi:hypothetical protein
MVAERIKAGTFEVDNFEVRHHPVRQAWRDLELSDQPKISSIPFATFQTSA